MPPFDVPEGDPFGPHNLPYGVFSLNLPPTPGERTGEGTGERTRGSSRQRTVGVRLGDHVLDAGAAARALGSPYAELLARPTLNPLLSMRPHSLVRRPPRPHRVGDGPGPP